MMPAREALSALLLLTLLTVALFLSPEEPGPGPLALVTGLAALHAALIGPAFARGPAAWGMLPLLLSLPALCSTAFGREGGGPLLASLLLVALASLSGTAARAASRSRRSRFYLPSMILLFAAPAALRYLVLEFGETASAAAWGALSPWLAAERIAGGGGTPAFCLLLLLAWPVWTLARRPA